MSGLDSNMTKMGTLLSDEMESKISKMQSDIDTKMSGLDSKMRNMSVEIESKLDKKNSDLREFSKFDMAVLNNNVKIEINQVKHECTQSIVKVKSELTTQIEQVTDDHQQFKVHVKSEIVKAREHIQGVENYGEINHAVLECKSKESKDKCEKLGAHVINKVNGLETHLKQFSNSVKEQLSEHDCRITKVEQCVTKRKLLRVYVKAGAHRQHYQLNPLSKPFVRTAPVQPPSINVVTKKEGKNNWEQQEERESTNVELREHSSSNTCHKNTFVEEISTNNKILNQEVEVNLHGETEEELSDSCGINNGAGVERVLDRLFEVIESSEEEEEKEEEEEIYNADNTLYRVAETEDLLDEVEPANKREYLGQPIVEVSVFDENVNCLIDTGSEVCAVSQNFVNEIPANKQVVRMPQIIIPAEVNDI
ncbi:glutamic acid-rich protein-like [Schistocerca cancellata]|uniref:glutamic acid-rich protein-like n=1 Tax=Schistocerca cancellata TaxID=274614 RepID=UPI002118340F|nr:glutamic acid-rich protein-like [Schistocerca cancellata]